MNPRDEDRSGQEVNCILFVLLRQIGKAFQFPRVEIFIVPGAVNTFCKESHKESGFAVALDDFTELFTCLFGIGEQYAIGYTPA